MRAIALVWGVLGLAGIALSVAAIARLPLSDLVDALKIVIVLVMYAGALYGLWSALRGRWPDIREWRIGYRIELGWFLTIFVPGLGFGAITAAIGESVRHPTAGMAFVSVSCLSCLQRC